MILFWHRGISVFFNLKKPAETVVSKNLYKFKTKLSVGKYCILPSEKKFILILLWAYLNHVTPLWFWQEFHWVKYSIKADLLALYIRYLCILWWSFGAGSFLLCSDYTCKEIQPVHPKGDQSWVFIGRTDAKAETPIPWPPHAKSWLTGKDPDAGRDQGQEEKGTTQYEMAGWYHRLDGHEFE